MAVSERELEEDEVRIDNLLHKILRANEHVEELSKQAKMHVEDGDSLEKLRMIGVLTETIANLALLADEIDQHDEQLTKELETSVRAELQEAVKRINSASKIV